MATQSAGTDVLMVSGQVMEVFQTNEGGRTKTSLEREKRSFESKEQGGAGEDRGLL
jgi:hypothetical protein